MRKSEGERQKQRNSIGKRRKMQSIVQDRHKGWGTERGVTRETGEKSKGNRRGRQTEMETEDQSKKAGKRQKEREGFREDLQPAREKWLSRAHGWNPSFPPLL